MFLLISSIVFSGLLGHYANGQINKFEATTVGCLQYNTNHGYEYTHPYFASSGFRNLQVNRNGVKLMRMGVLGQNDGIIRLAPVLHPYDGTVMHEIIISGSANTKTAAQRYTRNSPNAFTGATELKAQSSFGMMSPFEPTMFTLAVHPNGTVQLMRDNDSTPFLEFQDVTLSANYVGFCNWDVPVVFFYDCPLPKKQELCEGGVIFRKKYEEVSCVKN